MAKKIKIKKSKKGTFTKEAKKRGMSVQAFAGVVLANRDKYSPAMVKKANFARNAMKWKKQSGGKIDLQLNKKPIKSTSPFRFTAIPIKKDKAVKNVNLNTKYNFTPNLSISGGLNQDLSNLSYTSQQSNIANDAAKKWNQRPRGFISPTMNLQAKYQPVKSLNLSTGLNTNFKDPTQYNLAATYNRGPVGFGGKYNTDFKGNQNLSLEARQQIGKNTNLSGKYETNLNKSNRLGIEASQKLGPVKLSSRFNTDFEKDNTLGVNLNSKLGKKVGFNAGLNTDFNNVSGKIGLNWRPNNRLSIRGGLGYNTKGDVSGDVGLKYNLNTTNKLTPKKRFQFGGSIGFPNATSFDQVGAISDNKINYTDSTMKRKEGAPIKNYRDKGLFQDGGDINVELLDKNDIMHPGDSNNLSYRNNPVGMKIEMTKQYIKSYAEGGNVASTEEEFKNGLNDGINVFHFPSKGLKKMTMNPESGPIEYPVDYKGFTDGKQTDQGTAEPGEEFSVNGETVVETPNLSDMDFNAAFEYANKNKLPIFRWGENDYPIKRHMKRQKMQEGGLFSDKVTNKTKLDPGFKPEGDIN